MRTEAIGYQADGLDMIGHLALVDKAGDKAETRRPGVLIFPDVLGVSDHVKEVAARLAEHGYVALACDLHGGGRELGGLDEGIKMISEIRGNTARIRARSEGALAALVARTDVDPAKIAAIGYCFGGTMALELGRGGAELAAIVGFHSGLGTKAPEDAKNIKARVLVCIGADDPSINQEQRTAFEAEMKAAGVNWQMSVYGGVVHSFTVKAADSLGKPEFARYDEQADHRSWREMLTVFEETLD